MQLNQYNNPKNLDSGRYCCGTWGWWNCSDNCRPRFKLTFQNQLVETKGFHGKSIHFSVRKQQLNQPDIFLIWKVAGKCED